MYSLRNAVSSAQGDWRTAQSVNAMASFTINIQVADVVKTLTLIQDAFHDPSELMKDVLLVMLRSTQQNFEAQGRPERWQPLAQSTIDRRRGGGKDVKILRDTGLLLQSVGGSAAGAFEAEDGFGESDKFTAAIGTNRPGAEALQLVIAGGRVFLLFQDQDEEDIMDMASDWFLRVGPYVA